MTPSLTIDRTFRGVGRIKVRTGTRTPAVRRKLSQMLTTLADQGRLDMLRAIRDRRLTIMQVYDAFQRKSLDQLPTAETSRPLGPAMLAWIETFGHTAHANSLRTSCNYLLAEKPNALVSDLPELLERLRQTLGKAYPRSFNMLRNAASGFVRQTMKRSHPLYAATLAVESVTAKKLRTHHPLTIAELERIFPFPESDHLDAIAWSMALTGMGAKEYWGKWSVLADRIHIEGTKRAARLRDVPLVRTPVVPRISRYTFDEKLRVRADGRLTTYDLRRTYANILEAAGIIRTRRKMYMGHSSGGDITSLYERHDVTTFLVEDGMKLRQFVGVEHTPGLKLEARNA